VAAFARHLGNYGNITDTQLMSGLKVGGKGVGSGGYCPDEADREKFVFLRLLQGPMNLAITWWKMGLSRMAGGGD
jgi:hypothetical protein